jgi:alkylhydroperoxidase/carboxymuconolactone decarboxylase family protein YurZ
MCLKEYNFFVGEGEKAMLRFFALNAEKLFRETVKERTIDNKEKIWNTLLTQ